MFVVAESGPCKLAVRARELRGDRSLTEVAKLVGIRHDELGKIERGETSAIRFDTLLRLCAAFQVDVGDLLTIEPAQVQAPTLLDEVLAGVRRGDVAVEAPVGRGTRTPRGADPYQDLAEAQAALAAISEPATPRGRRRIPASIT